MYDGRQRHVRQIAQGNLKRPRRQTEFGRRMAERFEAGPVARRKAELPDVCEADIASEVTADHAKTGSAAVHLIDLLDVPEAADRLPAFAEQPALFGKLVGLTAFGLFRQFRFVMNAS